MLIFRELYGLKSSGAYCRHMLYNTLGKNVLGYTSITANKEIFIKRKVFQI